MIAIDGEQDRKLVVDMKTITMMKLFFDLVLVLYRTMAAIAVFTRFIPRCHLRYVTVTNAVAPAWSKMMMCR